MKKITRVSENIKVRQKFLDCQVLRSWYDKYFDSFDLG